MIRQSRRGFTAATGLVALVVTTVVVTPAWGAAEPQPSGSLTKIRQHSPAELGVSDPVGVAWSAEDEQLLVTGREQGGAGAAAMTTEGRYVEDVPLEAGDPALVAVTPEGDTVLADPLDAEQPVDATATDDGVTVLDGATGDLVTAPSDGSEPTRTPVEGVESAAAVAHNPQDGLTYVADTEQQLLVGVDDDGATVRTYDMSELGVTSISSMTFAPTADQTDDADRQSLYLLAETDEGNQPAVVEAELDAVAVAAATVNAQLIRSQDLSQLQPPSPDTAGITWMKNRSRLMLSDSEVNEPVGGFYAGVNLWETTTQGAVTATGNTVAKNISLEPTGVGYSERTGELLVSDDDRRRVNVVNAGADGVFGTGDDTFTFFSTSAFGIVDAEGIEVDNDTDSVFVVDGINRNVGRVTSGPNGRYDGVAPGGDDTATVFDVSQFGARDPEGMGYDPSRGTVLVLDDSSGMIYELTREGSLVNVIDLGDIPTVNAAGITVAPRSDDPTRWSYYIVDRGIDNDSATPSPNDGYLFEVTANLPPINNLPPAANAGPDLEIELPEQATLRGSGTDDGKPSAVLTYAWTSVSGPGTVTFSAPGAATTNAAFSAPGVYTLRLTVSDGALSDSDDVVVTVVAAGGLHVNTLRLANGADDAEQLLRTGFTSITDGDLDLGNEISAAGVNNGAIRAGLRWTLPVPPGAVVESAKIRFVADKVGTLPVELGIWMENTDSAAGFVGTNSNLTTGRTLTPTSVPWSPPSWTVVNETGPLQTTPELKGLVQSIVDRPGWARGNAVAFYVEGVNQTAGAREASSFEKNQPAVLELSWRSPLNQAPVVQAGPDQSIQLPATATLAGQVTDDGRPTPATLTTAWSMTSGPASVSFDNASSLTPTVTFSAAGTYVLRLTANDGALTAFDEVTVTVAPATTTPSGMTAIVGPGDWDGDRRNDLLARDGSGALFLYPGNGTGGYGTRRQVGNGWNGMTAIVGPGDWNGDGRVDLLARDGSGVLFLYPGNGTGGFGSRRQVGTGWNTMTAIVGPGDWNGDRRNDVLARDGSGRLWLYPGNGTGGFGTRRQIGNGWNGMTAIIGPRDWNGDARVDLLARDESGRLWLYPGNGTGGFLSPRQIGNGWNGMTAIVGPGDWNGDRRADLLARSSTGVLYLYPGNGTGGFLSPRQIGTGW